MSKPSPITVQVCDQCGLDWHKHIELDEKPTKGTCITLLKSKNQGPPGPQGPMGPSGDRWGIIGKGQPPPFTATYGKPVLHNDAPTYQPDDEQLKYDSALAREVNDVELPDAPKPVRKSHVNFQRGSEAGCYS